MFTTDTRAEQFLTQMGARFEYCSGLLLPTGFAPGWDSENLGRPVAVRDDAVLQYAELMSQGSAAPAPILLATDSGLRVLDGVQRLSAAQLQEITRVAGYVVTTDSVDTIAAIRVLANARMQGRAEPAEWSRRRAVEVLVIDRGMTAAEVAKMGGWKKADINRLAEAITVQSLVSQHGGPVLPDAMLSEVGARVGGTLERASQPTVALLHALKASKMATGDCVPLLDRFFQPLPQHCKNPYREYENRLEEIKADSEVEARLCGRKSVQLPADVVLLRELKAATTTASRIQQSGEAIRNADEYFRITKNIIEILKSMSPHKKAAAVRVPADLWGKHHVKGN